jgi:Ricin-type beta-trefoil lectin domain-like
MTKPLRSAGANTGNTVLVVVRQALVDAPIVEALLMLAILCVLPGAATAQDLWLKAKHSGKCAQVVQLSHANGAPIAQWDCVSQANVMWRKVDAGDGYFFLKARHSGKCAQVNQHAHSNGALISQWECLSLANLKWTERPAGNGYVYLMNKESRKCMHVNGASHANNAINTQSDCVNQDNVKWKLMVPDRLTGNT